MKLTQEVIDLLAARKRLESQLADVEARVRRAWPREAFENVLRQSGLALTEPQVCGISILVRESFDRLTTAPERGPEER